MPDKILQDGRVVPVNNQREMLDQMAGLGLPPSLADAEAASWRRFLPGGRKLPWKELTASEEEVARLEQRHREVTQERDDLAVQLRAAPEADLAALAEWERGGRRGPRPEPTMAKLEAEVERCQEEMLGLGRAVDAVTTERATYVARHRERLVREAHEATERAHERAVRAIDEVEQARAELIESRRLELWTLLYPSPEIGRESNWQILGGGLRRILQVLGLETMIAAEQVLAALRADVDWLATAASAEQQAKLPDSRALGQAERERARDQQLNDAARLRGQLARDERVAELDAMRQRI